jgi:uncharacterized damage-inducible protein DinB
MRLIDPILAELEQEAHATRRVLARVPEAHLAWRPHPKSFSLGQLALHVATIPGFVAELAAVDVLPEPPAFVQPSPARAADLVPTFDASLARAREVLSRFDDAAMAVTWRLMSGGKELMAWPRCAVLRTILLNHWYHHRGQLLVYLRVHDVPLPSVYGPTADENPFAATVAQGA